MSEKKNLITIEVTVRDERLPAKEGGTHALKVDFPADYISQGKSADVLNAIAHVQFGLTSIFSGKFLMEGTFVKEDNSGVV